MAKYGWSSEEEARKHVKVYTNGYDDLLDDPDVEAVIIALPLHLHAEAAIKAMKKGKHVLTEKLMARTVAKCKEMGGVAKQTGKYLATGHQRHYSILYDNAIHTIKNDLLGELHHIRAQWHRWKDTWQPPLPGDTELVKKVASIKRRIAESEKVINPRRSRSGGVCWCKRKSKSRIRRSMPPRMATKKRHCRMDTTYRRWKS